MTDFERLSLESVNTHAITDNKPKKGIAADEGVMASNGSGVTFADSLKSFTAQSVGAWTPEGEKPDVPDTWDTGSPLSILSAVKTAKEFLEKNGVDVENRVPTHEITDEQRAWLESRHDFEDLKNKSVDTPEFADLIADLYYLNVISEKDVNNVAWVKLPIPDGQVLYQSKDAMLIKLPDNAAEEESADRADAALKYLEKLIELERKRLDEKREEYYLDFIHGKTDEDYLNSLQSCFDIILDLFG